MQLSIYVDLFLASCLESGAPSALGYAVILINLPISAFGMSVAAAELPELSRAEPAGDAGRRIAERIDRAVRQSAFVVAPSVVGYLLFGFLVAGLVFRGGSFTREDNLLVYAVLCAYTLGLLASAISRLLQNTFFALSDTRTPAKIAGARLVVSAVVGTALMFYLDRFPVAGTLGLDGATKGLHLGAVGLALASSLGAWCELALLRWRLGRRLPELELPVRHILGRLLTAAVFALPALGLWALLADRSLTLQALLVLPAYAGLYLGWAWWRRLPELDLWLGRFGRRSGQRGLRDPRRPRRARSLEATSRRDLYWSSSYR